MSTDQLLDLGSVLTHKSGWMMTGIIFSGAGIAAPSVAPTLSQSTLFTALGYPVTMADISIMSGCFFAIVIGALSAVKLGYAIYEHRLSIRLKEKELGD